MKTSRVVLLGFRGTGKSTVASLVESAVKIPVIDLDARLEARVGKNLPDFILEKGDAEFRTLEEEELRKALKEEGPYLLVTGGGVVDGEGAFKALGEVRIPKILLQCEARVVWERLKNDPARLSVGGLENFSDLERLFQARAPKFRALATFTVDSQDLPQAAQDVARILKELP